jgi:Flp pilus assembly protein CpaB
VPPSIITDVNELDGKVAASRIDTKQFITAQTFVSAEDGIGGAFAQALKQDLVAVSVNVDAERGVANQIEPGDHVDIATSTVDENGNATTNYLLQNVRVLAVGASTVQPQATSTDPAQAETTNQSGLLTFEVTSDDALRVIEAKQGNGNMYLVLLPPKLGTSGGTAARASGAR